MKLKGLTKLALSGVALAAVAATLGTSTYAWYISNTTATVTGAEGSTAGADTSGSLYAASPSMYKAGKWSNTVTLSAGSAAEISSGDKDYETPVALQPVTLASSARNNAYNTAMGYTGDNAAKAVKEADGTFVDKEGKAVTKANGSYFDFSFYLIQRGDNPRKVNPKLTITNKTTGTLKTQTVYAANGNLPGSGLKLKDTFTVDAVHALRVEITNSKAYSATKTTGSGTSAVTTVDADTAIAKTVYDADRDFEKYTTKAGMVSGGEANLYYNDIVNGVNLYGCTQTSGAGLSTSVANGASANKWASFWLAPEEETLLTFRVWLEGTDAQNFDSCVGQAFDFQFEFELAQA
jgi:hypothetical protein